MSLLQPMQNVQPHAHLSADSIYPFDARGIAKRFRHAAIFGALDALNLSLIHISEPTRPY